MSTERNEDTMDHPVPRRRFRSPLAIAAMAAAVLVAGGGGAYWATANAGNGTADEKESGSPAPLALDGARNDVAAGTDSGSATAPGARYPVVKPLPAGPKSAPVHRPHGQVTQATVEKLAKALDVPGPVKLDHDFWRAGGTPDGSGPFLQVNRSGEGNWSYSRLGPLAKCYRTAPMQPGTPSAPGAGGGLDSPVCSGPPAASADGASGTSTSSDAASGPSAASSGPSGAGQGAVSEDRAKQAAAPALAALGLTGARVDASETAGAVRMVNADPVVGGLPTHGWRTTLRIGADGQLSGGYGLLATLEKGDQYPVVDAARALKQLEGSGTGSADHGVGGTCPSLLPKQPTAPSDDKTLPQTMPCVPATEQKLEVRGASFGLSAQFVSGARALVPSWLFDVAQAGVAKAHTVAQPAVEARYIQRDAPGTGLPSEPGGPGTTEPTQPADPADPVTPTDPKAPQKQKAVSYTVRGNVLELHFWAGVCSTYAATAEESTAAVTVRITGTHDPAKRVCIMIAKDTVRTVRLEHPLGDRKVVDLYDGAIVPLLK
ncbi:hypothetical protein [Streptomyces sp. H39-S7]|uniref:hypothetical protein n=1 Tax=Streptomyces sp. H39-S7 TaxID=3004357 RepID=UPI0022AFE888|nr:hypothetical protein [Streptomyces sp. H39-S7]MCZ4121653.1 hypothetical protein [Streptomyces sp. H39-S7]